MSKSLNERELLQSQIKTYEFYAGLIDRAVGGGTHSRLPKWDELRAEEYRRLAEELRVRLAELTAQEGDAPAASSDADKPAAGSLATSNATTTPSHSS